MEVFVENHVFNLIRLRMDEIVRLLKYNSDKFVVEAVMDRAQDYIEGLFVGLEGDQRDLLQMRHLVDEKDVRCYMASIEEVSFGMKNLTEGQIKKLFRKEKKLKLPEDKVQELRHSYLGWEDEAKKRLYFAYTKDGLLKGMAGQVNSSKVRNTTMCTLCGHMSDSGDVVNLTVRCKTKGQDEYHTIGFNVCRNSVACNSRITEPERLENLLNKVSGPKKAD